MLCYSLTPCAVGSLPVPQVESEQGHLQHLTPTCGACESHAGMGLYPTLIGVFFPLSQLFGGPDLCLLLLVVHPVDGSYTSVHFHSHHQHPCGLLSMLEARLSDPSSMTSSVMSLILTKVRVLSY